MKIAIIGGGASGMIAGLALKKIINNERFAKFGRPLFDVDFAVNSNNKNVIDVFLFDKNKSLGVKVMRTGGGRCNITTGLKDNKLILQNYPRGSKFFRTALYSFGPDSVIEMFENAGVNVKIEEDLRVFPVSDKAETVVKFFEDNLKLSGVNLNLGSQVISIENLKNGFLIVTKTAEYVVDKVIIATGGSVYKNVGSGYYFAEKLGHKITDLKFSLSALKLNDFIYFEKKFGVKPPVGVSFKNVSLKLKFLDSDDVFTRKGPVLFTHFGVTGPAIFALSSLSVYKNIDFKNYASLFLDLFPDFSFEELDRRLIDLIDKYGKKSLKNILDLILPKSFCRFFVEICGFDHSLLGFEIDKLQRKNIVNMLKNFELKVIGRVAGEEFVTAGGVDLSEVNHKTMESKIVPGLYFAGEVLDIDGFTGGFNLQVAWSTGYLAGISAGFNSMEGEL